MSDTAEIIHASADACRLARAYGCTVNIEIRRGWGGGTISVSITPNALVKPDINMDGQQKRLVEDTAELPVPEG